MGCNDLKWAVNESFTPTTIKTLGVFCVLRITEPLFVAATTADTAVGVCFFLINLFIGFH